jgi:hypothetical protein
MRRELVNSSNIVTLTELRELIGPPPVLSTEDASAYDKISARLMQCYEPRDFVEQLLILQLTDCWWEIARYMRHKTWAVDRKFRELRASAAKNLRERQQQTPLRRPEQGDGKPLTELARMWGLEDFVWDTVKDVDEILIRPADERTHARALERAIDYYDRLDQLLNAAIARRDDVLAQIEEYRHASEIRFRKANEEMLNAIIDAEYDRLPPRANADATPLAPPPGEERK